MRVSNMVIILLQLNGQSCGACLKHGDVVQMGSTLLLLHIHLGTETCDACEPGQVMAQLQKTNKPGKHCNYGNMKL